MSSLTVARQRGICTRFPTSVHADENARTQFERAEKTCSPNLIGRGRKVNAGGGPLAASGERLALSVPHGPRGFPALRRELPSPRSCALRDLHGKNHQNLLFERTYRQNIRLKQLSFTIPQPEQHSRRLTYT